MNLIAKSVTLLSIAISLFVAPANAATLAVRKNVVDLTTDEKNRFVNAIQTLKTTIPDNSQISIYDQFIAIHRGAMSVIHWHEEHQDYHKTDAAHENSSFLPWHREYILRFEKALQSVDPTVTIPYWDWTDAKALDVIFQPDFLGTNGQGITINIPGAGAFEGGPVVSGNFSPASGWFLKENLHIDPDTGESQGTALIRFLKVPPAADYPIPQAEIDRILELDDYLIFRPALEGFISFDKDGNVITGGFTHNYIHALVGGARIDISTMPPKYIALGTMSNIPSSPYDPVFWLHHSNVDRLWAEWQDNGHAGNDFYPASGQPFGHNLTDPMWPWDGGMSTPLAKGLGDLLSLLPVFSPDDIVTPADLMDYRKLGYTYDSFKTSVPEPTYTLGLFSLGVLAVGTRLLRKGKRVKNPVSTLTSLL